jgi:NADPH-dependent 2,4-dienoyl-CoA reductase/sulfur reductase-like enzyme
MLLSQYANLKWLRKTAISYLLLVVVLLILTPMVLCTTINKYRNVAIVGGGIGGLATALKLGPHCHAIDLFDSNSKPGLSGASAASVLEL